MTKRTSEHTTSVDSPPVEAGRDVSKDSPPRESAPAEPENSKPIQNESL